jgi:hypothetical protein
VIILVELHRKVHDRVLPVGSGFFPLSEWGTVKEMRARDSAIGSKLLRESDESLTGISRTDLIDRMLLFGSTGKSGLKKRVLVEARRLAVDATDQERQEAAEKLIGSRLFVGLLRHFDSIKSTR